MSLIKIYLNKKDLDTTLYLYDLTSIYFEGKCADNPQAKRGYSGDKRPDCKQLVIVLVVDGDGFPKAHEIFDGNRKDSNNVEEEVYILCLLKGRREKDRSVREKQEKEFLKDREKLKVRIRNGRLKKETKIHQAIVESMVNKRYLPIVLLFPSTLHVCL